MQTIKTIRQSMAGLAASAVLAFGLAERASAFNLITNPDYANVVAGIEDLNIGGTLFDVVFEYDTFDNVYGNVGDLTDLEGDIPTFWDDESGAEEAAATIIAALGDDNEAGLLGWGDVFDIGYGFLDSDFVNTMGDCCGGVGFDDLANFGVTKDFEWMWARLSEADPDSVLEPTILESPAIPEPIDTVGNLIFDPNHANVVTGIEALDIGGKLFDVVFKYDTFDNLYGNVGDLTDLEGNIPTFWDDESSAEEAATQIIAALGDDNEVGLLGWGDVFDVGYGFLDDNFVMTMGDCCSGVKFDDLANFGVTQDTQWMWAQFSESNSTSVPEPTGTVAILAIAGTGMLASRKKRKQ